MASKAAIAGAVIAIIIIAAAAAYVASRGGAPAATSPAAATGAATTTAAATSPAATSSASASPAATSSPSPTKPGTFVAKIEGIQGNIIPIGGLLPLTGDLSSYGINSKAALELAQKDINAFLQKAGLPYRVKIYIEDTQTKPTVCLQKLQALAAKGIKVFVGPMTSAEVKQIMNYANENHLVIISPSSTAPSLAIPNDYIFRFCPTDNIQGPVIAKMAKYFGKKVLIIMWRGDAWGDGLHNAVKKAAQKLGIIVIDGPRYDPNAKEFSNEVAELAQKVQQAIQKYGADKVAVDFIGFNEVVQVMDTASQYPVLSKVMWFGSDGTALLSELLKDPTAAEFAAKVHFLNPIFAATKSQKYDRIVAELKKMLGRTPDTYALASYDAAWVAALSILITGKYDGTAIKNILPDVAYNYFGATGWIVLNKAGDRAFADYNIYAVVKEGGKYAWKLAGVYHYSSDTFTWYINFAK